MSTFDRFDRIEEKESKTIEIEETLYRKLEQLSKEVYDAPISKLVNACIEEFLEKEDIELYDKCGCLYVKRNFLIKTNLWNGLCELKDKYDLSMRFLINAAIRNAFVANSDVWG